MTPLETIIAKALQSAGRQKILDSIKRGACSASMSGIEYFPEWDESPNRLRKPYIEQAKSVIAALDAAGFVLVPREPTQGMLVPICMDPNGTIDFDYARDCWGDILKANPHHSHKP